MLKYPFALYTCSWFWIITIATHNTFSITRPFSLRSIVVDMNWVAKEFSLQSFISSDNKLSQWFLFSAQCSFSPSSWWAVRISLAQMMETLRNLKKKVLLLERLEFPTDQIWSYGANCSTVLLQLTVRLCQIAGSLHNMCLLHWKFSNRFLFNIYYGTDGAWVIVLSF